MSKSTDKGARGRPVVDQCLVCCGKCPLKSGGEQGTPLGINLKEWESAPSLSPQLNVIFVLRRLLLVPATKLEDYLKEFGNPNEWQLSVCKECREQIKLAKQLHEVVLNAAGQLKAVQRLLVEKMKSGGRGSTTTASRREAAVFRETRDFVLNYNYDPVWEASFWDDLDHGIITREARRGEGDVLVTKLEMASDDNGMDDDFDLSGEYYRDPDWEEEEEDEKGKFPPPLAPLEPSNDPLQKEKRGEGRGPPIQCFLCDQVLATDRLWSDHLLSAHDIPHMICPAEGCRKAIKGKSRVYEYRRHAVVHQDATQLVCDICERVFKWKRNLIYHKKNCGRVKRELSWSTQRKKISRLQPYHCLICEEEFIGRTAFRNHNRAVHRKPGDGEETSTSIEHKCRSCGQLMANRENLLRHIRFVHQNEREYRHHCDLCPSSYYTPHLLKVHVLTRHKEDPAAAALREQGFTLYRCPEPACPRIFLEKEKFEKHTRGHVENGGARPLSCAFCGKGFYQIKRLREHELIHKNAGTASYLCNECGKSFPTLKYLKSHERYNHQQTLEERRKRKRAKVNIKDNRDSPTGSALEEGPADTVLSEGDEVKATTE